MTQLEKSYRSLYICYFGVREPLVQTQVIPYLLEIAKDDVAVSLLTFEPEDFDTDRIAADLQMNGITWHRLRYHKRPSAIATMFDVINGTRYVASLMKRENFDILHSRVHVPMLMAALARKMSGRNPKILFDIRGFFPEEYIDAGIWDRDGRLYNLVKRVEKWLMKEANAFVVLTEKAKEVLFPESASDDRPVEVIPCCVDLNVRFSGIDKQFREESRTELGLDGRYVVTHLGALGGLYLTEQIADFLRAAREKDPRTYAIFLTQSDPELIIPLIRNRGFSDSDFLVSKVSPAEVPRYLAASDAALSFVKATYATLSRSPTKNAEYLACGVPIVANRGVGDVDELIQGNGVGVIVDDLTAAGYSKALAEIDELGDVSEHCQATARREFDLEAVGGARYRRIYRRLLGAPREE
jgi:glycosyltransferase involved in cell wall biosynthesis